MKVIVLALCVVLGAASVGHSSHVGLRRRTHATTASLYAAENGASSFKAVQKAEAMHVANTNVQQLEAAEEGLNRKRNLVALDPYVTAAGKPEERVNYINIYTIGGLVMAVAILMQVVLSQLR